MVSKNPEKPPPQAGLLRSLELQDLDRSGEERMANGELLSDYSMRHPGPRGKGVTLDDLPGLTSPPEHPVVTPAAIDTGMFPRHLRESLLIILSGQYGLLIVVVGAVLPVVETFANPRSYMFEGFYVYLYVVSTSFLVYVYTYLLRRQGQGLVPRGLRRVLTSFGPSFRRTLSSGLPFARNESCKSIGSQGPDQPVARWRRRRVAYNDKPNNHTGSFYLRVGAIAFGIGSMIHSGLTFGHYFEIVHLGNACSDVIQAVKPFLHLLFTFTQMYFIFMNSKMCIYRNKTLARFGLMHMAATNICVWLRSIVVETLHEIQIANRSNNRTAVTFVSNGDETIVIAPPQDRFTAKAAQGLLPELKCQWDALMGRVLEKSTSYLYPCIIEYSLICASVLYVMWNQVGDDPRKALLRLPHEDSVTEMKSDNDNNNAGTDYNDDDDDDNITALQRMSVDCSGSQRGLFTGLFLFVGAVVILVIFYVMVRSPDSVLSASVLSHASESLIYLFALTATIAASVQMRGMRFCRDRAIGVEQTLAIVSLTGLIAFSMFNIVAAIFSPAGVSMAITMVSNVLMLCQACAQALFMLAAMRLSPSTTQDVRRKPGRQWVTFLLVCNFALWGINTFETQRMEHNLLQVAFYGSTAWNIFCHVSVPLGIYYRFHSTVCLSNIWKNAWKIRTA